MALFLFLQSLVANLLREVENIKVISCKKYLMTNNYNFLELTPQLKIFYILFFKFKNYNPVWYFKDFKNYKLNTLEDFFFLRFKWVEVNIPPQDYIFLLYTNFYFTKLFGILTRTKYIESSQIIPSILLANICVDLDNEDWSIYGVKHINEIINIFLTGAWLKDVNIISHYIIRILESKFFKEHKKFFKFFFKLFDLILWENRVVLGIRGILFQFRGKLAKGGDSRKSVIFYKRGYYSLSCKALSIHFNKWAIWTKSGSVGCTFHLFYNCCSLL